ncbi:DnaJ domain containing protein [Senna tora]|uniref:DnaJ domain containing protein n=1 Tax=Senna tora TaxID=362788 RepID=A0A834SX29_9FABA|nr:DnaJ domain containing protein [Senna tora]
MDECLEATEKIAWMNLRICDKNRRFDEASTVLKNSSSTAGGTVDSASTMDSVSFLGLEEQEHEALDLKAIAETKYKASNLKSALKYAKRAQRLAPHLDAISQMVTSLDILSLATNSPTPDWYKILQVEPFAHINAIRKQYKKLALILHPDKNPHMASEEAFKLVSEAFRFLSDKIRRKEYDMKLRIRIQEEATEGAKQGGTFWTACSTCRLLHQFQRRYVGHNLICPSCKKSFKAMEVENNNESEEVDEEEEVEGVVRVRNRSGRLKRKMGKGMEKGTEEVERMITRSGRSKGKVGGVGVRNGDLETEKPIGEWIGGRLKSGGLRRKTSTVGDVLERSKQKKIETGEEMMTLAEMQSEMKRKAKQLEMTSKLKEKEKEKIEKRSKQEKIQEASRSSRGSVAIKPKRLRSVKLVIEENQASSKKSKEEKIEKHCNSSGGGVENMALEDSDFHDFDKDRVERSFKKGQVWAVYDDDDGMPRNYVLIDEVVSINPFEVTISWLDLQNNGDDKTVNWDKMGFHISCGKFKVSRKTSINSINIFSHVVDCERAAREVYRIYPKKGSVWALYNEAAPGAEGRNLAIEGRRCYDIVVFLTNYSEMIGLSMAYLEKVKGYKTVFKRQEVGSNAIRLLERDDFLLVSHQIPAQKLSGNDSPELLRYSWDLDLASLPADLS